MGYYKNNIEDEMINYFNSLKEKDMDNLKKMEESYKHILECIKKLLNDLKIDSSISIGLFFSYLLYKGYFSYNYKHFYTSKGVFDIIGHLSYDILSGKGVCRHYSEMLSDIYNDNGVQSFCVLSKVDELKYSYKIKLDVNKNPKEFYHNNPKSNKPNHICSFIVDKNDSFIYDATNATVFAIKDYDYASHVMGLGFAKIFLDNEYSIIFNTSSSNMKAIQCYRNLNNGMEESSLFARFLLDSMSIERIFNSNLDLLNDFHYMIEKDVLDIHQKSLEFSKRKR